MKNTKTDTTDPTLPQIVTQTKFMQNYRVAAAVNGGSEIAAIRNSSGDVELFTIGSDGTVWNFYPDSTSETGYRGVSTGLQAGAVSAGVGSDGTMVVFTAVGLQLFYLTEINLPTSRWSKPTSVPLPLPPSATNIARIVTQEIAGNLFVGVLTEFKSATGPTYSLSWSQWQTSNPVFNSSKMNVNSLNCVWLGSSAQNAAFACVDNIVVAYAVATGAVTRYPMAANFQSLSVDAATDSTGNSQIFAILADGNAYHLVGGAGNQPYSWVQLSQAMIFRQIETAVDDSGNAQVFAVSGDNNLYHWQPLGDSPTGYSFPPISIYQNVAVVDLAANDAGEIDLFVIGTAQKTLFHLFQQEISTNWQDQRIEVPTSGEVEEYVSYTSDITAYDALGAILVNAPVNVWASERSRVTINGATYLVDANRPARTSTNSAGTLSIAQETGSLAIPSLQINFTAVMPPNTSIAVHQSADVQNRLASVKSADLMDAKDAAGNYLLADQYRNAETTTSLANGFNQFMTLAGTPPANATAFLTRNGTKPGVFYRASGVADELRLIGPVAAEQHWQMAFNGFKVSYRDLTKEEALALLVEKRASIQSAAGVFDWLEDVGDFLVGVAEGIVDVIDTIVTTVQQGIQAAFTFVVNGVTYLFEKVVTFIEQAFDAVEIFFAQVKVFFEKIFEWLGFLFNWPDILRTHEAVCYVANEFLTFVIGATAGIQTIVDNGFDNFQNQIADLFNKAITQIAGNSSIGGFEQTNKQADPQFDSATSNNIVYNNLVDNAGSASSLSPAPAARDDPDPLSVFMTQLQAFGANAQTSAAFASAKSYFQNLGGSPDQIFTQLLSGLLRIVEGVLQAAVAGVKALADTLLQLAQLVVAGLQTMLNEEWDIPFVSDFYSWIADGAKLSTLDLFALIAAIPATILYKAIKGAAPFPDAASVTAFKNSFNAQTMLTAVGFGHPARRKALQTAEYSGLLPKDIALLTAIFGGIGTFLFGAFTAVNDLRPAGTDEETVKLLSIGSFVLEVFAQGCSFPWWYSAGGTSCDGANPDGCGRTLWIFQNVGILMDGVFLKLEGKLPENTNDAGIAVQFVYSIVHLTLAILASEGTSGLPVAANILPVLPELSKPLRLTDVVKATKGGSLVVLAVIDGLCYVSSGIIGIVLANSIINSDPTELVTAAST